MSAKYLTQFKDAFLSSRFQAPEEPSIIYSVYESILPTVYTTQTKQLAWDS